MAVARARAAAYPFGASYVLKYGQACWRQPHDRPDEDVTGDSPAWPTMTAGHTIFIAVYSTFTKVAYSGGRTAPGLASIRHADGRPTG